jgi:hypothetical protein
LAVSALLIPAAVQATGSNSVTGSALGSGRPPGTLTFAIPPDDSALGATVELDAVNVDIHAPPNPFQDGVLPGGKSGTSLGQNLTFDLTGLSILDDGTTIVTWAYNSYVALCPCVVVNGTETVTITTAASPEPASISLVALSLLAMDSFRSFAPRKPNDGVAVALPAS